MTPNDLRAHAKEIEDAAYIALGAGHFATALSLGTLAANLRLEAREIEEAI